MKNIDFGATVVTVDTTGHLTVTEVAELMDESLQGFWAILPSQ